MSAYKIEEKQIDAHITHFWLITDLKKKFN